MNTSPVKKKRVKYSHFKEVQNQSFQDENSKNTPSRLKFKGPQLSYGNKENSNTQTYMSKYEQQYAASLKSFEPKFFSFLNEFSSKLQNLRIMSNNGQEVQLSENQNDIHSIDRKLSKVSRQSSEGSKRRGSRDSFQIIEANLENGKINGNARLILPNGGIFSGQVSEGNLRIGKIVYQSGLQYEGSFQNNVFHGVSTVKTPQGNLINIGWKNGVADKKGKITYKNGDVYTGQMKNFKKHGFGELIMNNKKKFVGRFHNGEVTGEGTLYQKDNKILAKGMWFQGKFIGNNSSLSDLSLSENSFT